MTDREQRLAETDREQRLAEYHARNRAKVAGFESVVRIALQDVKLRHLLANTGLRFWVRVGNIMVDQLTGEIAPVPTIIPMPSTPYPAWAMERIKPLW